MRSTVVLRFGPFELDVASRQLFLDRKRIPLSTPQSAILTCLVSDPGAIVSKETLTNVGWGGAAITDNSIDKAISGLRRLLGDRPTDARYIETLPHLGYRFTAPVQQAHREVGDLSLEAQLAPYRSFMQGHTELDTLDRDAIQRARRAFEEALSEEPEYAPAHIGLATACALAFEATPLDTPRDPATLELGIFHARRACVLAPMSGEAWSALAFGLRLQGDTEHAVAAACKAMAVEPENWRLALRAAYACWGEERLQAARRVLTLRPGLALAHWLRTTVFIARGALDAAAEEARAGCAAQDAQAKAAGFPAVGLHLLHGLVLAAHDRLDDALAELKRELEWADSGQLYARECAANTWYALGAVRARQRNRADAEKAFQRALTISPRHVSALAALRGEVGPTVGSAKGPAEAGHYVRGVETAIGEAVVLARGNRHADAARVYRGAVEQAPPGYAGWMLPVEPMIHPLAHREIWADALALIAVRAT